MKKSSKGTLPVTSNHHRQDLRLVEPTARRDADATLSLKFPTQVSSLFFP